MSYSVDNHASGFLFKNKKTKTLLTCGGGETGRAAEMKEYTAHRYGNIDWA